MSKLREKGDKKSWEDNEEYEKRNNEELEKCKKDKKDHEFRGTVSIIIEACAESRDQSNKKRILI